MWTLDNNGRNQAEKLPRIEQKRSTDRFLGFTQKGAGYQIGTLGSRQRGTNHLQTTISYKLLSCVRLRCYKDQLRYAQQLQSQKHAFASCKAL